MKKKTKMKRFWLLVSIALIIISILGASFVQTSGWSVEVGEIELVVGDGSNLYARIFIPKSASADNKLPLIIAQHGSQHNLEMQDMNYVELARRGYVVIAGDAFRHGHSSPGGLFDAADGMANVRYLVEYACDNLSCIDTEKIGLVGHSMGASIVSTTLQYYVEQEARGLGENKIAAVLEIGYDPAYEPYTFEGVDEPVIADADWGVIAGKYDEYFFRQPDAGNDPARILESQAALDFVRQVDPSAEGPVEDGKYYSGEVNGEEYLRVYYQNPEIHPQNVFSTKTSHDVIEFFYTSLGVPNGFEYIGPDNQVWYWKQIFNGIGLVGILMFLFPFASLVMDAVPFFSTLKSNVALPPAPALNTTKKKLVFWGGYVICMLLPAALAMPVMHYWVGKESFTPGTVTKWFGEGTTTEIAVWAIVSAVCILGVSLLSYLLFSKKYGMKLDGWGYKISVGNFFKSLLLAFMTFLAAYLILFVADFFFNVDFRFWLIAMRTFNSNKFLYWLAYVPAFIIFYLVNSLMVNGCNRVEGMPDWLVTVISCIANSLGLAMLLSIQYIVYSQTGTFVFNAMRTHNLFPFLVLVPVGTIITRRYFKETGNIYLGSFTIAMLYTMMQVTQVAMNVGLIQ